MLIYKITNLQDGKIYIGQTNNTLDYRFNQHFREARSERKLGKTSSYFHNALLKYGIESFSKTIIDRANSQEELDNKEIFWINFLGSTNPTIGYNLTSGGSSGLRREETKQKISEQKKLDWQNPEIAIRMRQGLTQATEAWREKAIAERVPLVCKICNQIFILPQYLAKNRKYCSNTCAGKAAMKIAHIATKEQLSQRRVKIKDFILSWACENASLILTCPKNKITSTLQSLFDLTEHQFSIKDIRSIMSCIIDNQKPSRKEFLLYLQSYVKIYAEPDQN